MGATALGFETSLLRGEQTEQGSGTVGSGCGVARRWGSGPLLSVGRRTEQGSGPPRKRRGVARRWRSWLPSSARSRHVRGSSCCRRRVSLRVNAGSSTSGSWIGDGAGPGC